MKFHCVFFFLSKKHVSLGGLRDEMKDVVIKASTGMNVNALTTRPVLPAIETDFAKLMSRSICTDTNVGLISSDLQDTLTEDGCPVLVKRGDRSGRFLANRQQQGLGRT